MNTQGYTMAPALPCPGAAFLGVSMHLCWVSLKIGVAKSGRPGDSACRGKAEAGMQQLGGDPKTRGWGVSSRVCKGSGPLVFPTHAHESARRKGERLQVGRQAAAGSAWTAHLTSARNAAEPSTAAKPSRGVGRERVRL